MKIPKPSQEQEPKHTKPTTKRIKFFVSTDDARRLKAHAAMIERTQQEVLSDMLTQYLANLNK